MIFFVTFFALFLLSGNNAMARLVSQSNEENPSIKPHSSTSPSPNLPSISSEKERKQTGQRGHIRNVGKHRQNQGQATSTAYDKSDFTISIDVGLPGQEETMAEKGGAGENKTPGQSTYSTAASLTGAQPISSSALNRAKASDALKKKLQAENKKKFQLQDVSGEKSNHDPRQDIINKLVEASQDIEK